MKGNVSTKDIILKGLIEVDKNLNLETLQATENKTYNVPEGVDGWDEVVVNVPSEEITIESKSITENGTYNAPVGVAGYNPITVDVQPDLEDIKITENGTYTPTAGKDGFSEVEVDVDPNLQILEADTNGTFYPTEGKDGFSYAVVNVPTERAVVVSKTVTANGTYNVPTGVDGYNPVIVNVPQSGAVIESKSITENGTYTPAEGVDGFAPVVVNVPSSEPTVDELTTSINHNGTFNLTENKPYGVDYYDPVIVTVNVPERVPVIESKSITENGTYTAPTGVDGYSPITVNVPLPANAYLLKELSNLPQPIASFNDGADAVMQSLKVDIEPVQDLHGYDSPWAGGAGKNKFNTDFENTTINRTTITKQSDGKVKTSGVPSTAFDFLIGHIHLSAGTYILNGCPSGGGSNTYRLQVTDYPVVNNLGLDTGNGASFTLSEDMEVGVRLQIYTGASASLEFAPMIRLSTVSDATFAPYYNICPISGWTEEVVTVTDDLQNPTVTHTTTIPFTDGQGNPVEVYGGSVDVVNGGGNAYKEYPSYNGETLIGPWISDRDVYAPNTTPTIGAQVVDMGDTTTFTTQPTSIKSLDVENNVFASTGDVTECEYFTPVQ